MTTRRNFLTGAAASGIAFCSCGLLDAAHAQPKAQRLPVNVMMGPFNSWESSEADSTIKTAKDIERVVVAVDSEK